jgi:hypothetical protein
MLSTSYVGWPKLNADNSGDFSPIIFNKKLQGLICLRKYFTLLGHCVADLINRIIIASHSFEKLEGFRPPKQRTSETNLCMNMSGIRWELVAAEPTQVHPKFPYHRLLKWSHDV